jgi:hypothetical protein
MAKTGKDSKQSYLVMSHQLKHCSCQAPCVRVWNMFLYALAREQSDAAEWNSEEYEKDV